MRLWLLLIGALLIIPTLALAKVYIIEQKTMTIGGSGPGPANDSELAINVSGSMEISGNITMAGSVVCTSANGLCGSVGGGNVSWNESYANTKYYLRTDGSLDNRSWNESRANNLYYPLSSNPSGYLTSYTETDPIWSAARSDYVNLTRLNNATICRSDGTNCPTYALDSRVTAVNSTSNIKALGFNITSELTAYYDGRYSTLTLATIVANIGNFSQNGYTRTYIDTLGNASKLTGTCAAGYVVQNVTANGPQCVLDQTAAGGGVTQVNSGAFLTGGPITTSGTIALNASALAENIGNFTALNASDRGCIGDGCTATAAGAWAFGDNADAKATESLALGTFSFIDTTGLGAIAIGASSDAYDDDALAIGTTAYAGEGANNQGQIAIGRGTYAGKNGSIAIGDDAESSHQDSIVIGRGARSTTTNQVVLGTSTNVLHLLLWGTVNTTTLNATTLWETGKRVCLADGTNCPAYALDSRVTAINTSLTSIGNWTADRGVYLNTTNTLWTANITRITNLETANVTAQSRIDTLNSTKLQNGTSMNITSGIVASFLNFTGSGNVTHYSNGCRTVTNATGWFLLC